MGATIRFHLPARLRDGLDGRKRTPFYGQLIAGLRARGATVTVEPYEKGSARGIRGDDGDLHVVNNGSVYTGNALNAGIAYLEGYWHLDPQGILSKSSIATEPYLRRRVPRAEAWVFFEGLRERFARSRRSRYAQPRAAPAAPPPDGCIALFLQGSSWHTKQAQRMPSPDMIRAVVRGCARRPVRIKPHPLKVDPEDLEAVAEMAAEGYDVSLYEGNVHDLLGACCTTVSISSACSFEGFLHRKPAILYGRSDYMQFATQVEDETADAFSFALARALGDPPKGYSQFVWWYLSHCLRDGAPDLVDRALARMSAMGWTAERLGLSAQVEDASGL